MGMPSDATRKKLKDEKIGKGGIKWIKNKQSLQDSNQ